MLLRKVEDPDASEYRARIMRMLGHKKIENALIYTQLIDFEDEDEFHSATARNTEEVKKLVESGFSHVCGIEGVKLFRKRK